LPTTGEHNAGDKGVKFRTIGGSDSAQQELTPMPMVNNAMASENAAMTKAFAFVVRLNILFSLSQKGVDLRM
jgi:hypothetical protein